MQLAPFAEAFKSNKTLSQVVTKHSAENHAWKLVSGMQFHTEENKATFLEEALNNTPESAWDPEADGGALRCFVGAAPDDRLGDTAEEVLDVAPVGGRTVLFPSRDLLHAVTPRCLLPHHRHTHTRPRRRRLWRLRKAERVGIRRSRRRRLAMTAWIFDPQILSSEEMAQFVG